MTLNLVVKFTDPRETVRRVDPESVQNASVRVLNLLKTLTRDAPMYRPIIGIGKQNPSALLEIQYEEF